MCERFGCLPSALYDEPADLLRLLRVEALGRPDDDDGGVADLRLVEGG